MSDLWGAVAFVVVLLLGVGSIFTKGRSQGRAESENKQHRSAADAEKKASEVRRDVDVLTDDEREQRLRDKWTR